MTTRFNRRALFAAGAVGAIAFPAIALQRAPPLVGVVSLVNPRSSAFYGAFEERLRALGHVDGRDLTLDFIALHGDTSRFPAAMSELVARRVAVIVAGGPEAGIAAATRATHSIPIVAIAVDYDPVAKGYVASLAHPGGNVTGVAFRNIELTPKRLDLLRQAVPGLARVVLFYDRIGADEVGPIRSAAATFGIPLQPVEFKSRPYDYDGALAEAEGAHGDALMAATSPYFFADRERIAAAALKRRLPSIAASRGSANAGYLMSYGPSLVGMFGLAADYVHRILNGAKPADLPVEQPTKFELAVNLKTAKALGLAIPPAVLARADEVVE